MNKRESRASPILATHVDWLAAEHLMFYTRPIARARHVSWFSCGLPPRRPLIWPRTDLTMSAHVQPMWLGRGCGLGRDRIEQHGTGTGQAYPKRDQRHR